LPPKATAPASSASGISTAVRGSRARLTILPSLTVHANRGHTLTERAEALTNGRAALPMSG